MGGSDPGCRIDRQASAPSTPSSALYYQTSLNNEHTAHLGPGHGGHMDALFTVPERGARSHARSSGRSRIHRRRQSRWKVGQGTFIYSQAPEALVPSPLYVQWRFHTLKSKSSAARKSEAAHTRHAHRRTTSHPLRRSSQISYHAFIQKHARKSIHSTGPAPTFCSCSIDLRID